MYEPVHERFIIPRVDAALREISVSNGYQTDPSLVARFDQETDGDVGNPVRTRAGLIEYGIDEWSTNSLGDYGRVALERRLTLWIHYYTSRPDHLASEPMDRILSLCAGDVEQALSNAVEWSAIPAHPESWESVPFRHEVGGYAFPGVETLFVIRLHETKNLRDAIPDWKL